jgi:hypothetical protein
MAHGNGHVSGSAALCRAYECVSHVQVEAGSCGLCVRALETRPEFVALGSVWVFISTVYPGCSV